MKGSRAWLSKHLTKEKAVSKEDHWQVEGVHPARSLSSTSLEGSQPVKGGGVAFPYFLSTVESKLEAGRIH